MFKKYLSLVLMIMVANLTFNGVAFANNKEVKEAKFALKLKTNVVRLGTGTDARIEVKLRDKTKLKGYISQINENSFVVVEDNTGTSTEVPYSNAKQVKGNNLSTGVKIAIGIGLVIGVLIVLAYVLPNPE